MLHFQALTKPKEGPAVSGISDQILPIDPFGFTGKMGLQKAGAQVLPGGQEPLLWLPVDQ
jgi:hypothetical protein